MSAPPLNICIVYDRLYPASIGGAERWYSLLAERLAAEGHRVTYITTRHWDSCDAPNINGVAIISCLEQRDVYRQGRRRILPVLQFGLAVAWQLLRRGRGFDVVQTSAMSSWAAIAVVACARPLGYRAVFDWWEVWPYRYWQEYLGRFNGTVGRAVQRALARSPHQPIAYSTLHAARLKSLRRTGDFPIFRGLLPKEEISGAPSESRSYIVSVGRLIPEKQMAAILPALALARQRRPGLRAVIVGEGPDEDRVRRVARELGLTGIVDLPGVLAEDVLQEKLRRALCLVLLSRREGYGLVVAEAAALGVPCIVLRHRDSAATELIEDGVNGIICESSAPIAVASAILRVHEAGHELRLSTMAWYRANASELTIEGTVPRLLDIYRGDASRWKPEISTR